jgi:hypothetical protein
MRSRHSQCIVSVSAKIGWHKYNTTNNRGVKMIGDLIGMDMAITK